MTDEIEWTGSKSQKEALREKFGGRCAYCGERLTRMHADHLLPIIRLTKDPWGRPLPARERRLIKPERNTVSNMMPSCPPCNISKGGHTLEGWRDILTRSAEIVAREKSIFRAGVRFGLIEIKNKNVEFFFERFERESQ